MPKFKVGDRVIGKPGDMWEDNGPGTVVEVDEDGDPRIEFDSGPDAAVVPGSSLFAFHFEPYVDPIEPREHSEPTVTGQVRTFSTGATRDQDTNKLDFEGFLSPTVIKRFGEYMHKNRKQADGSMRASDNWQKGIPLDAYMKSMFRHFFEVWSFHRGAEADADKRHDALCALLFNVQGYLHESLKEEAL